MIIEDVGNKMNHLIKNKINHLDYNKKIRKNKQINQKLKHTIRNNKLIIKINK